MGALDSRSVSKGNALFEVTLSVNPRVAVDYVLSADGMRRHLVVVILTVLWVMLGSIVQLSLNEQFPELPLYPLPVVVAYLALRRPPLWALCCALLGGALVDSLWFARLGTTSAILAAVYVLVMLLRCCLPDLHRHFRQSCYVAGTCAVFLYVSLKLLLYCVTAWDSGFMDLMPRHLLVGPILNGLCVAPVCFTLMDAPEWLLGLKSARTAPHKDGAAATAPEAGQA